MTPVQVGEVLAGKYRVERVLGHGGMGVVVAATHLQLGQRVALKFLLPDMLDSGDGVERFLREARAAVQIRGEHVARVLDVGTLESGAPYIVMEYLDGTDLSALLRGNGPLPVATAVDYVLQSCEALAEAHTLGIVHRDLKPANLFLTRSPDGSALVKVLDFGISKVMGARLDGSDAGRITATAAVMGSPLYMSPEQITSARDVDHRTDIWSLGVILHELLAAQPPYMAETAPALMVAIAVSPPASLRSHRADAPAGLEMVVARCLEKDRQKRYADVAELARALVPFASSDGAAAAERTRRVLGVKTAPRQASPSTPSAETLASAAPGASSSSGNFDATATVGTVSSWGGTGNSLQRRGRIKWLVAGATLVLLVAGAFVTSRALRDPAPAASAALPTTAAARNAIPSATALPAAPREPVIAPLPTPREELVSPRPDPTQARDAATAREPLAPADERHRPRPVVERAVKVKPLPTPAKTPAQPASPRGKDLFNDLD